MQPEPTFDDMQFYNAHDIAQSVGCSIDNIYYHFRKLRKRNVENLPAKFPLDGKNARRLWSFIIKS